MNAARQVEVYLGVSSAAGGVRVGVVATAADNAGSSHPCFVWCGSGANVLL